jgi:hypothetical protein
MRSIFFIRYSSPCVQTMVSLRAGVKTYSKIISVTRTDSMLVAWPSPYTSDCRAQNRQSIFGLSLAWETPDLYLLR